MKLTKIFLGIVIMAIAVGLQAAGQSAPSASQKAAIQRACASGALSPEDCKAKLAALGASAPTGGSQTYNEPRGRFTMTVPAGWTIVPEQDSVKLTHGDSWARFQTINSQQPPLAVAHAAAGAMQPMYTKFSPVNDSPFQQGSHAAAGMTVDGAYSAKDGSKNVSLLFTALAAGGGNYVTMSSSTPQPGGSVNGELMQIFGSIRFSGE